MATTSIRQDDDAKKGFIALVVIGLIAFAASTTSAKHFSDNQPVETSSSAH